MDLLTPIYSDLNTRQRREQRRLVRIAEKRTDPVPTEATQVRHQHGSSPQLPRAEARMSWGSVEGVCQLEVPALDLSIVEATPLNERVGRC